jgi:hypothetical protein
VLPLQGDTDQDLQFAVLMWLEDASHPDLVDCKAAVVACPAVVRLLASGLGQPTQPLNRLLALSTMERLARVKLHRGPMYPHMPTAARIAVDPGPASRGHVPATHCLPGNDIQLAMHSLALKFLTNTLDSDAHRDTALAAAPRLLEVVKGLLAAGARRADARALGTFLHRAGNVHPAPAGWAGGVCPAGR